jgi:hypothetical protein
MLGHHHSCGRSVANITEKKRKIGTEATFLLLIVVIMAQTDCCLARWSSFID